MAYSRLHIRFMQQDDHKPHNETPENAEEIEATAETPEAQQTPENQEGTEAAQELDPWEQLEAEAAKWKDTALRTAAEMDNLRKRTTREREEAIRYANQRLLEDILPVIDNFDMGMLAAAEDKTAPIYVGMDMVRKQLKDFLSSQGVEEISNEGQFDPNLHDAVSQEPSEQTEGDIIRVMRKGYKLRDRLLRPSSVVVAASQSTEQPEG